MWIGFVWRLLCMGRRACGAAEPHALLCVQVLDTCAAPGSKTAQILEMLHHGAADTPTGLSR
jgi:hypothetical protein